ncbi:MAG: hypothetical protein R3C27_06820 [Hyphomonadaceae bacterium]
MTTLAGQTILRVAVVALALTTLSFAAGVAGDLSIIEPPRSGQRVVLRIPPEIPDDAPRARPLLSTASAEATPARYMRRQRREEFRALVESVQAAHEDGFEFTPIAFEPAALPEQKPRRTAGEKPVREAPLQVNETKAA